MAQKSFHLSIARVGESLFDGDVVSITLPGKDGVFTVLAHHEAFVTELQQGEAHIEHIDGSTQNIPIIHTSIAEISNNQTTILL